MGIYIYTMEKKVTRVRGTGSVEEDATILFSD